MAAGTVISGGFPGRVAQEVQPNPKCNGCLHYDPQAGRTGACTIGLRPWLCGDGSAADIGYAPLARGAGTYLPGMSNLGAHAPGTHEQETSDLYGAGSTRPVQITQVSLGEEAVHFVKSLVSRHTQMQKSTCRLCQSGGAIGAAPANVGPQICSCAPIEALTVAKALSRQLSNRERSVIDIDDLVAFVYDVAKAGFKPLVKGTFYHAHGKYEVSPAGGGSHNVDFHPKGGGPAARVGTYGSHREARRASESHARRFAAGTGAEHGAAMPHDDEKTGKHSPSRTGAITLPSMHGAVSVAHKAEPPSMSPMPAKVERDMPRISYRTGQPEAAAKPSPAPKAPSAPKVSTGPKVNVESVQRVPSAKPAEAPIAGGYQPMSQTSPKTERTMPRVSYGKSLDEIVGEIEAITKGSSDDTVEKADAPRHPHDLKVGDLVTHSSSTGFHHPDPKVAATHGQIAQVSSIKNHPHSGEPTIHVRYHESSGKMSKQHLLSGYDSTRHPTTEDMQHHAKALKRHFNAKAKLQNPSSPSGGQPPAPSGPVEKSLDALLEELHNEEDVEKSLRWSHKEPGTAKTSHGKYTVHENEGGGHTVTYTHKETGKSYAKTFASRREALGAVTEHHLKNRPPPKPRKKKDPNAPKAPKAPGGGPCPPCP